MTFKTNRQMEEFEGAHVSSKLKKIIKFVDLLSQLYFEKEIVITELFRTQKEQDGIYGSKLEYQKKPWQSVHQYGRGCDLRSTIYTPEEIKIMVGILNGIPYSTNGAHKTAQVHDVGCGLHFHIQVSE